MTKRKSRTICFRVSEEDYQALKGLCEANGGRSVSELARRAMHEYLGNGANPSVNPADVHLESLGGRLEVLERAVERLAELTEMRQGRST